MSMNYYSCHDMILYYDMLKWAPASIQASFRSVPTRARLCSADESTAALPLMAVMLERYSPRGYTYLLLFGQPATAPFH